MIASRRNPRAIPALGVGPDPFVVRAPMPDAVAHLRDAGPHVGSRPAGRMEEARQTAHGLRGPRLGARVADQHEFVAPVQAAAGLQPREAKPARAEEVEDLLRAWRPRTDNRRSSRRSRATGSFRGSGDTASRSARTRPPEGVTGGTRGAPPRAARESPRQTGLAGRPAAGCTSVSPTSRSRWGCPGRCRSR